MKFIKPKRMPEANIQAELYRRLRSYNIPCCLEYRIKLPNGTGYCRADIVVIDGDSNIACIIEVKSRIKKKKPYEAGRQYQNYESLGIPFMYCMGWWEIEQTMKSVLQLSALEEQTNNKE